MNNGILSNNKTKYKKRRVRVFFLMALTWVMLGAFGGILYVMLMTNGKGAAKEELKNTITQAAARSADLKAIKTIFFNLSDNSERFFLAIPPSKYYDKSIPLTKILEDVRVDVILEGEDLYPEDSTDNKTRFLVSQIDDYLTEIQQTDPYEGLDSQQKRYFESIRIKAGSGYSEMADDISDLAADLKNKNTLIEQYLSSSNLSLYLSVAALVFTIIFSMIQFYLVFKDKKSS